ncbi:MAG: hypothetical protein QG673_69 [Pseudomonadota bacterium]|nr:hypothetical protein [Pseudomonadota bacterium]
MLPLNTTTRNTYDLSSSFIHKDNENYITNTWRTITAKLEEFCNSINYFTTSASRNIEDIKDALSVAFDTKKENIEFSKPNLFKSTNVDYSEYEVIMTKTAANGNTVKYKLILKLNENTNNHVSLVSLSDITNNDSLGLNLFTTNEPSRSEQHVARDADTNLNSRLNARTYSRESSNSREFSNKILESLEKVGCSKEHKTIIMTCYETRQNSLDLSISTIEYGTLAQILSLPIIDEFYFVKNFKAIVDSSFDKHNSEIRVPLNFIRLSNLEEINLVDICQINSLCINQETFQWLNKLIKLKLSFTSLKYFYLCDSLKNLEILDLSNCNRLIEFSISDDVNLANLQKLDLSSCIWLEEFKLGKNHNLNNLQELDLSNCNELTRFSISDDVNLANLQKLDLSNCNELIEFSISDDVNLANLQKLDLKKCKRLKNINIYYKVNLNNLQELDLSNCNELTQFSISYDVNLE